MRLADRRGLLRGRALSRVQDFALDLVMVSEAREKSHQMGEEFKRAILSADPGRFIPMLYPEWGIKTDDDITDEDLRESEGDWKFVDTKVTPEEAEALLSELMNSNTITLTGDDVLGDEQGDDEGW